MAKKKVTDEMWRLVQSELGKKGGHARAKKYDQAMLSKWGKMGGRPRKDDNQKQAKGRAK
jgi:hypothetical protein